MDGIDHRLAAWLERQPVFFVATAPLGARMSLEAERDVLDLHNAKKGPRKLVEYRVDRNAVSIDGLPAWPQDEPVVP
jgi:hypothetical protein